MAFDQETAETIAPVLAMVGQQARVDPNWACTMIETVAGQVLPDFYASKRETTDSASERAALDLKLVLISSGRTSDLLRLAQTYSDAERLEDALYWIGRAIDARPDEGEYFRFKASILERMRAFEKALGCAREAQLLGADADAIRADIERIERGWVSYLRRSAKSEDLRQSVNAYAILLDHGWLRASEVPTAVYRLVRLAGAGLRKRSKLVHSAAK